MTEFVFRPSRQVNGKRVRSPFFVGRYSLRKAEPLVTVALETTDERVARKRLRDIVAEKQREAEGIVASAAVRSAGSVPLVALVAEYRADLIGRGLAAGHVRDTIGRITRMISGAGWALLHDVRPESFVRWRASVGWAAKTKREYQTSINAFLNWLVRIDRLLVNPLAKVDRVDTRGKAVRKSRAFSVEEIRALCASAPVHRRLVYLFLVYTGSRKNEARALRWSDLSLGESPFVLFRAENTKSGDKRTVPLKPELAALLREQPTQRPDALVFVPFPSDDALHADLARAGIARKDSSGRLVHFHAFRKTFQTWGAASGVNQRAAQELLGHSDPALTANVYTDVAALALHGEVAKLPWFENAQSNAHEDVRSTVRKGFRELLTNIISLAQAAVSQGEAAPSSTFPLAARHGFEPCAREWQTVDAAFRRQLKKLGRAQWDAHARAALTAISLLLSSAKRADQNGGAQRPDKARQLDRNAVLGPAGSQAGGFPALGGGGRGVGDASTTCGRRMDKAGGPAHSGSVDGHASPAPGGTKA